MLSSSIKKLVNPLPDEYTPATSPDFHEKLVPLPFGMREDLVDGFWSLFAISPSKKSSADIFTDASVPTVTDSLKSS